MKKSGKSKNAMFARPQLGVLRLEERRVMDGYGFAFHDFPISSLVNSPVTDTVVETRSYHRETPRASMENFEFDKSARLMMVRTIEKVFSGNGGFFELVPEGEFSVPFLPHANPNRSGPTNKGLEIERLDSKFEPPPQASKSTANLEPLDSKLVPVATITLVTATPRPVTPDLPVNSGSNVQPTASTGTGTRPTVESRNTVLVLSAPSRTALTVSIPNDLSSTDSGVQAPPSSPRITSSVGIISPLPDSVAIKNAESTRRFDSTVLNAFMPTNTSMHLGSPANSVQPRNSLVAEPVVQNGLHRMENPTASSMGLNSISNHSIVPRSSAAAGLNGVTVYSDSTVSTGTQPLETGKWSGFTFYSDMFGTNAIDMLQGLYGSSDSVDATAEPELLASNRSSVWLIWGVAAASISLATYEGWLNSRKRRELESDACMVGIHPELVPFMRDWNNHARFVD